MKIIFKNRKTSRITPEQAFFNVVVVSIMGIISSYVSNNLVRILTISTPFVVSLGVLVVGFGLYWFRCKYRVYYGIAEVIFGIMSVWNMLFSLNKDINSLIYSDVLPVLGGLYVVVRGLDNVSNGLDGKSYEPAWWRIAFRKVEKNTENSI